MSTPFDRSDPNVQAMARRGKFAPGANPQATPTPGAPLKVLTNRDNIDNGPYFGRIDVDLGVDRSAATGTPASYQVRGNVFAVKSSTLATDAAEVRFGGAGAWIPVVVGDVITGPGFEQLEVRNASQPSSTMVIIYATDPKAERVVITMK
jgi:hypothetical protein